jgi:hypothetical protein
LIDEAMVALDEPHGCILNGLWMFEGLKPDRTCEAEDCLNKGPVGQKEHLLVMTPGGTTDRLHQVDVLSGLSNNIGNILMEAKHHIESYPKDLGKLTKGNINAINGDIRMGAILLVE